jgi:hypothetical protein
MTTNRILGTFDIKPTPLAAALSASPDELMIDWTTLPAASTASLYLPSITAQAIVDAATRLYGSKVFTQIDAHTVVCRALGVTYMPIPRAGGNLAGLIDVELPANIPIGREITVAVSQLTSQSAIIPAGRRDSPFAGLAGFVVPASRKSITWRKVTGTFQLALKVQSQTVALPIIERNLSLLRWVFEAIPHSSRWYPIFVRYLGALADQVSGLGGDPNAIPPSATGSWPFGPGYPSKANCIVGKIQGLVYDHFGDFEGFILETESGDRIHFFSREAHMKDVVRCAWADRLRVTVTPEDKNDCRPRRIVLHPSPHPL